MNYQEKSRDALIKELGEFKRINREQKDLIEEFHLKIKESERYLNERSERFAFLYRYSIELINQPNEKVSSFIVNEFKSFFKIKEVWISTFDEKKSELVLNATTLSEKDNTKAIQYFGKKILGLRTRINETTQKTMLELGLGEPSSLHNVSFGQIPDIISSAFEKIFGFGWFQGITLTDRGRLFGGLMVAGYKGQEKLNKDELRIFTEITSNILRRKQIEKELIVRDIRDRQLSDLLPMLVFDSDNQGKITFANQHGLKLLGYSKTDINLGIDLISLVAPDDRPIVLTRLKEIINGAETSANEYHIIRKGGQILTMIVHLQLIIENDNHIGFRGIGIDITDRKLLENEIRNKNEQLQKMVSEKDKFFSIIAHDLRNPLSVFLGYAEMLTENFNSLSVADIKQIGESLKKSASNLYILLVNLLEWSRIQRGMMDFVPEIFNIEKRVTACVELMIESAKKKEIMINFNIPENLKVSADIQMFDSVIRNLVSNAIKFTPNGGHISISISPSGTNRVGIKIRDTGIGMNKHLIENLFNLGEQTNRKGTDGEPSSGLGLLLCKEFIEKHGGNILVESEEDKGSTFYFTIPDSNSSKLIKY